MGTKVKVTLSVDNVVIEYTVRLFGKVRKRKYAVDPYLYRWSTKGDCYVICDESELKDKTIEWGQTRQDSFAKEWQEVNPKHRNITCHLTAKYSGAKYLSDMSINEAMKWLTPEEFKKEFGYLLTP